MVGYWMHPLVLLLLAAWWMDGHLTWLLFIGAFLQDRLKLDRLPDAVLHAVWFLALSWVSRHWDIQTNPRLTTFGGFCLGLLLCLLWSTNTRLNEMAAVDDLKEPFQTVHWAGFIAFGLTTGAIVLSIIIQSQTMFLAGGYGFSLLLIVMGICLHRDRLIGSTFGLCGLAFAAFMWWTSLWPMWRMQIGDYFGFSGPEIRVTIIDPDDPPMPETPGQWLDFVINSTLRRL